MEFVNAFLGELLVVWVLLLVVILLPLPTPTIMFTIFTGELVGCCSGRFVLMDHPLEVIITDSAEGATDTWWRDNFIILFISLQLLLCSVYVLLVQINLIISYHLYCIYFVFLFRLCRHNRIIILFSVLYHVDIILLIVIIYLIVGIVILDLACFILLIANLFNPFLVFKVVFIQIGGGGRGIDAGVLDILIRKPTISKSARSHIWWLLHVYGL